MEKDLVPNDSTEEIFTITSIGLPDHVEEIQCAHVGLKEIYAKWGSKEGVLLGAENSVTLIYL